MQPRACSHDLQPKTCEECARWLAEARALSGAKKVTVKPKHGLGH